MTAANRKRKPKQKRKANRLKNLLTNLALAGLVAILVGFSWSIITNSNSSKQEFLLNTQQLSEYLAKNEYELKTNHRIQVVLKNGCGFPGLAKMYEDYFRQEGIDVVETGNAGHFNYESTKLILHRGEENRAILIADLLGIDHSRIEKDINPELFIDVTIILGSDFKKLPRFDDVLKATNLINSLE